jgi:hypothetical protein
MIMLDPHRTFAAGPRPDEPRVEPRVEPRAEPRAECFEELRITPPGVDTAEARLLRALSARLRRVRTERAPATLRERVRTLLDPRA